MRKDFSAIVSLLLVALSYPAWSAAADRDRQSVEVVISAPPGGTAFEVGSVVSRVLRERAGVEAELISRPGPLAEVAVRELERSGAGGTKIVLASTATLVINPLLFDGAPLSDLSKVTVIGGVTEFPLALVARRDHAARDLLELVRRHKEMGRPAVFASAGVGSTMHIAAVLFSKYVGIEFKHLPYRGSAAALEALVNDKGPDLLFEPLAAVQRLVKAGEVKVFAVTSRAHIGGSVFTTFSDFGVPLFLSQFHGLIASKNIDQSLVSRIERALVEAASDASVIARVESMGGNFLGESGGKFRDRINLDRVAFQSVLTSLKKNKEE